MSPLPYPYRHFTFLTALFSTALIVSNIIAVKLVAVGGWSPSAGVFTIPIAYVIGDMMTEVYGARQARRAILTAFGMLSFTMLTILLTTHATPSAFWHKQAAFQETFGLMPRVAAASLAAYLAGGLINSHAFAAIRRQTGERHFYLRALASTIIGEAVDTALFLMIAFGARWNLEHLWTIGWQNYLVKVALEIPVLPFTYLAVAWLKREECEAMRQHYELVTSS